MIETLNDLKRYFKLSKDLSMLLSGEGSFINCYNPITHRLHGRVNTLGANTHRMTHSKPNLTQLSKDKDFRELLRVPEGKLLVDVDADALELVILGHYLGKYDDYEFAKIVDSGDKTNFTDIHSVNQRKVGLASRDEAKTFIYAVLYGAGNTKIGAMLYTPQTKLTYTDSEYRLAKESIEKRVEYIDDERYFPITKGSLSPYDESLILKTIYGMRLTSLFRDSTLGYKELIEYTISSIKEGKIITLDSREVFVKSKHSALNLLIQSSGAIFMKYLLVEVDRQLRSKWKHGKEFAYVANVHDALNIEIIPEIEEEICEILKTSFEIASYHLGLKYPVKGKPKVGLNQYTTH